MQRQQVDGDAQPDALGPLRGHGRQHQGRGHGGEGAPEVQLSNPSPVEAQLVRQFNLFQGILVPLRHRLFGCARHLVKDAKLHTAFILHCYLAEDQM